MLQKNVHRGEKGTLWWGKLSPTLNQEITGGVPPGQHPPLSLVDIMDPTECRERGHFTSVVFPQIHSPSKA